MVEDVWEKSIDVNGLKGGGGWVNQILYAQQERNKKINLNQKSGQIKVGQKKKRFTSE